MHDPLLQQHEGTTNLVNSWEQAKTEEILTSLAADTYLAHAVEYKTEELGRRGPRKGKRVPREHIRQLLKEYNPQMICVEGAKGVGKTSLLQQL